MIFARNLDLILYSQQARWTNRSKSGVATKRNKSQQVWSRHEISGSSSRLISLSRMATCYLKVNDQLNKIEINLLKSLTDECLEKRKLSLLKGQDFLSDLIHLFVLCFAIWILSWLIFAISFLFSKFDSFLGLFFTLSSRALTRFNISFFSLMFSRSVSANWWLISLNWYCIWLNSVNNVSIRLYSNSGCNCLCSIVFL